jgi:hypothetical protein
VPARMRVVAICDRSSQELLPGRDNQPASKTQALQAPWGGPEIRRGEVPLLTRTSPQLTKDAQGGNLGTDRCWGSKSGRREFRRPRRFKPSRRVPACRLQHPPLRAVASHIVD